MKETYIQKYYVICIGNNFLAISSNHGVYPTPNGYGEPCTTNDINYTKLWHNTQTAERFIDSYDLKNKMLNLSIKLITCIIE